MTRTSGSDSSNSCSASSPKPAVRTMMAFRGPTARPATVRLLRWNAAMNRHLPASPRAAEAWTWEDFVLLPDDDRRELIDGELVDVEVPTKEHEHVVSLLIFFLVGWARPRHAGIILASGYKVRVSQHRGVMPDVQFYRADNPNQPGDQGLEAGRPDLAVEVMSPGSGRHDRV